MRLKAASNAGRSASCPLPIEPKMERYGPEEVKAAIDLVDIFERDGHVMRRVGTSLFCLSPWSEEKTPSCKVTSDYYRCFSSAAGGDVFNYWMDSRGCDFPTALRQLRAIAFGSEDAGGAAPLPKVKKRAPAAPKKEAKPLAGEGLEEWLDAHARLAGSQAQRDRIAEWRGYRNGAIDLASRLGLAGLYRYYRLEREAFLVEMPDRGAPAGSGARVPVSAHVRLAPRTRGNDGDKQSWRYCPSGVGSWPFIIGDLASARTVFLLEGQWDALALADCLEWPERGTGRAAVVGMRGSTSFRTFLDHYYWPHDAAAVAVPDHDQAGSRWLGEDGFLAEAEARFRTLIAFTPGNPGDDFNDVYKRGEIDRASLAARVAPALARRRGPRRDVPTFLAWCRLHRDAEGELGAAARMALADKAMPRGRQPLHVLQRSWLPRHGDAGTALLSSAWEAYAKQFSDD